MEEVIYRQPPAVIIFREWAPHDHNLLSLFLASPVVYLRPQEIVLQFLSLFALF